MSMNMNMNKRLQTLQRSILQTSNDILSLTKHIIKHRPMSRIDFRQMLLKEQQQQQQQQQQSTINRTNRVVLNLLKMDKEVNLMQYHGIPKYVSNQLQSQFQLSSLSPMTFLMDKWNGGRNGGSGTSTNTNSNSPTYTNNDSTTNHNSNANNSSNNSISNQRNNTKKAKVAFMITAQQRQILMSELNYTQQQIKRMKPNEAQLILEHSLYNDDDNDDNHWKDSVKELIVKEEELQRLQEQKEEEEMKMKIKKRHENHHENVETNQIEKDDCPKVVEARIGNQSPIRNDTTLSIGFEEQYQYHNDDDDDSPKNHSNALLLSGGNNDSISSTSSSINTSNGNSSKSSSSPVSNNEHEELPKHDAEPEKYEKKGKIWYEVIESPSEEAVALYKTHKEAQECIMIKGDLQKKQTLEEKSLLSSASTPSPSKTFLIRERII